MGWYLVLVPAWLRDRIWNIFEYIAFIGDLGGIPVIERREARYASVILEGTREIG